MKVQFSKTDDICMFTLSGNEMRALFDSLDNRIRGSIPMNISEHKAWEVLRRVIVGGEEDVELDALMVHVKPQEEEENGEDHPD
jgi:hypothetical protein